MADDVYMYMYIFPGLQDVNLKFISESAYTYCTYCRAALRLRFGVDPDPILEKNRVRPARKPESDGQETPNPTVKKNRNLIPPLNTISIHIRPNKIHPFFYQYKSQHDRNIDAVLSLNFIFINSFFIVTNKH